MGKAKLLDTKGGRYTKPQAETIAEALSVSDPEWKYQVSNAPENSGLFCVEVREQDNSFIGRW